MTCPTSNGAHIVPACPSSLPRLHCTVLPPVHWRNAAQASLAAYSTAQHGIISSCSLACCWCWACMAATRFMFLQLLQPILQSPGSSLVNAVLGPRQFGVSLQLCGCWHALQMACHL